MLSTLMRRGRKVIPAVFKTANWACPSGYVTGTSTTIPLTAVVGELLVLIATCHSGSLTPSPPTGWTLVGTKNDSYYGGQAGIYQRICQAGDPGTTVYLNNSSSGCYMAMAILVYQKTTGAAVFATTVYADESSLGPSYPYRAPSLNATKKGALVACVYLHPSLSAGTGPITLPGSITSRFNATSNPAGGLAIGDFIAASVGATGNKDGTTPGLGAGISAHQIQF